MQIYYEDYRLKVVETDGKYTIYDSKYGWRVSHKNKNKEWTDNFINRAISKREKKEESKGAVVK